MDIIDAHLHFSPEEDYFSQIAKQAGHQNTAAHLQEAFYQCGIVKGIVMGNRDLALSSHEYPAFLSYCIGIDGQVLLPRQLELIEGHLQRQECVGIKLYPGYQPTYLSHPMYEPVYELAAQYQKPVAIHMGLTASANALLKYSHPLTLDEVAVAHPHVSFVMCHFGNPWLMDAAAVVSKNENVYTDLSGLLEGQIQLDQLFAEQSGYISALQTWLAFIGNYDKILFGTDWPLVNLSQYIQFIARIIPERHHDKVFCHNAARVYRLSERML